MHHRTSSVVGAELSAFLAEHLGTQHSGDVGPLLGQAAQLSDRDIVDETPPEGFHEAVNVVLSEASGASRRSASAHEARVTAPGIPAPRRTH
ncbi:MAG: hypothetical protein BroJett026_09590 [Betaproteobacteria bacterium]|nr:MAG: hypothetical protein BroJett026_09590 [Betaproteobacteria bacterium]